jgi:vitamin B12 transporter
MDQSSRFGVAVLVGCAPLVLPVSALAQEPIQLPGIYVQGATLEAPAAPRRATGAQADNKTGDGPAAPAEDTVGGVPAYTIGNAITVVTGEELRQRQVRDASEALRSLPGVSVSRSGGLGNITQVRIRGAEAPHTLVLIDGIEANTTADGEFDFSNLSADDLERIEIIRGPLSSLYGSNALGGVINIITRGGRGPLALTLRSEAGTLGTRDFAARLSGGSDSAHIAVSSHWRETNGFNIAPFGDERDGSRLTSLGLKGGVRLLDGITLDFTMRYIDKFADRDGFGGLGTLGIAVDDPSVLNHRVFLGGANLRWDMLEGKLTHEFRVTRNDSVTSDNDSTFGLFRNVSEADKAAYLATYRLDTPAIWAKHSFSALVAREAEQFRSKGAFGLGGDGERSQLAFAGEWRGGFADRLFLTAGIRRDDNEKTQDFTTWRLAASLKLPETGVRPHASVGTAVKLPTMFEQFGITSTFIPNPNLAPEESFGWDAGLEFTVLSGRATLDVTYFNANLTNKIFGTAQGPLPNTITSVNLPGESTRQGVEVAGRVQLTKHLSLGAAYTFTDARDPNGVREVRRPPHAARADLGYSFANGRGTASLAVVYNGTMNDLAFEQVSPFGQQRVLLDSYWVVTAAVSYKLEPGVEVFGRVENLFDARYQEVFGFQSAPIAAFAGIKLTFGGPDGVGGRWAK